MVSLGFVKMSRLFSVDLGGSSVRVGHGTISGGLDKVSSQMVGRHGDGCDHELVEPRQVLDFVASAIDGFGVEGTAAGFSFPGLLDAEGRVEKAPNLSPEWQGLEIAGELSNRTGLPVAVGNDARVAALGEFAFGGLVDAQRRSCTTMVYIGLGTGVGGGVVVNGELLTGPGVGGSARFGAAGEIGHVVIDPEGEPCLCGGRGCVETVAGGAALVGAARQLRDLGAAPHLSRLLEERDDPDSGFGVELIARAARAGDHALVELLDRAASALGILAANLMHILAPDFIVLGGGISALEERLVSPMWRIVRERVHMVPLDALTIATSALEDRAGLLGGLVLAGTATVNTENIES